MTDLKRWKESLTSFGIKFSEDKLDDDWRCLDIDDPESEAIGGPTIFCTQLVFDAEDKFVGVKAFERLASSYRVPRITKDDVQISDMERWKEFLTSLGIKFTVSARDQRQYHVTLKGTGIESPNDFNRDRKIGEEAREPARLFTQIVFDKNGKIVKIGEQT